MEKKKTFFGLIGEAVVSHPLPVILVFLAVVAASALAAFTIEMKTQISDLLPEENPGAQVYTKITDNFSSASMLMVTVEGPDRDSIIAGAESLVERIKSDTALSPLVKTINLKLDREFLVSRGLMMEDADELSDYEKIFASANLLPLVTQLGSVLEDSLSGDDPGQEYDSRQDEEDAAAMLSRLELFLTSFRHALENNTPPAAAGERLASDFIFGEEYTMNPAGNLLVFIIRPAFNFSERKKLTTLTDGVRGHIRRMESGFPNLAFGTTGDVAQEADEESSMSADATYPSIAAFMLVFVLLAFSFSNIRSIVFSIVALAAGILIAIGIAAVTVGEFNMITSSFGAILVGLGIDFGLHVVSRFDEKRLAGFSIRESMISVLSSIGLPVSLGAITTAFAFFTLLFSNTKGFRQFGLVAGTGIITTLAAMLLLLPALLVLFGKKYKAKPKTLVSYGFLGKIGEHIVKVRPFAMAIVAILLAISFLTVGSNRFEYDMRKIGPQNTPSRLTEIRLMEAMDISSFTSMAAYDSLDEARIMTTLLRETQRVGKVESVTDYLPDPQEQDARLEIIGRISAQNRLSGTHAWDAEKVMRFAAVLQELEYNVIEIADLSATALGEDNAVLKKRHTMIREQYGAEVVKPGKEVFRKLIETLEKDPAAAAIKLSAIDREFASSLDSYIKRMSDMKSRMTVIDLPESLKAMHVSDDGGSYLVMVYPDKSISNEASLISFADGLSKVEENATGSLQLGIALSEEIQAEAFRAVILVGIAILITLVLSFRDFVSVLLAAGNLAISIIIMMGLYPLIGKLNFVNMLALPLIIGIGIDYSIHIIHQVRRGAGLAETLNASGKAILLSGITTIFGFGSLALAGQFAGIASLGSILALGTTVCLLTSLVFIPAVLSLLPAKEKE